MTIHK